MKKTIYKDMISMIELPFVPTCCEWITKRGSPNPLLAM